ncbi:hypothetical protein CC1G_10326 [Coprinopsis cinerea okayama7|uniref:Sugar phosphate transporter domain-containing protein n=1 Tax=Coprinopsis cinerea (strain Okayama-7 / 130 / ATCC MYA-4618 / FGSC 9003) TaxID=240176 RepID=A8P0J5_COPC7|nr:hypothetical protein CC1G_10326 [Coprinopsis cinerea okayama7\|eukprot:XP_001837905.2 hypothetical protein CC1G_10326 [Coprinopsis cinerea okayama7\
MAAAIEWSSSGAFWLAMYFVLNLALTLYNKIVLNHFPFPYTLTALHALCGTVGTFVLLHWNPSIVFLKDSLRGRRRSNPTNNLRVLTDASQDVPSDPLIPPIPTLRGKELVVLFLYSILYSLNIVVSNASLRLVTVPFHQVVRASAPLFTVALSAILLGKYSSRAKLITLIPVTAGVGLATYGDYYFTPRGFFLTLFGTLLAALKTITTNLLQKRSTSNTEPGKYPPTLSPESAPFKFPPPPSRPWVQVGIVETEKGAIALETIDEKGDKIPSDSLLQTEPLLQETNPAGSAGAPPPSTRNTLMDYILPTRRHRARLHSHSPISIQPTSSYSLSWNRIRLAAIAKLDLPKLSLTPLQLLYLLSPIAFIQTTLLAHFSGELDSVSVHLSRVTEEYVRRNVALEGSVVGRGWAGLSGSPRLWLVMNGVLAFMLNVVSFNANRKVGALAMSVAANVKQVLAVLCSVTLFNLTVTVMNGAGIFLTLVGGAWYAAVQLQERKGNR